MKIYIPLMLAAFLLACKPAVQATTQSPLENSPVSSAAKEADGLESEDMNNSGVINGIAIVPGVERLSYISPKYMNIRPEHASCIRLAQGDIAVQMDCAETESKFQDARMNRAYQELIAVYKSLGNDYSLDISDIASAQRAWIAFSDLDCSTRSQRFGSKRAPTAEVDCRMKNIALRAQQLEDWRISFESTHP